MSTSNQRLFLQKLSELHSYLRILGEHTNQIYNALEKIERNIMEMNDEQKACIETNKNELEYIKGIIVNKSEVNDLLEELNKGIEGSFSPLPTLEQPTKKPEPKEKEKIIEPIEEEKKRRFPFFSRFWTIDKIQNS